MSKYSTFNHYIFMFSCLALAGGCSAPPDNDLSGSGPFLTADQTVKVQINSENPLHIVDPNFLSVTLDSAQIVGVPLWEEDVGAFDFSRPMLRNLAKELSPAYLRIGGTDADKVFYQVGLQRDMALPDHYEWIQTEQQTDNLYQFASDMGFDVVFGLNGGPGPRDQDKVWLPDNAEALLAYSESKSYDTAVWELSNEPSVMPVFHAGYGIPASQLVDDYKVLKRLRDQYSPSSKIAGIDQAFFPPLGEVFAPYLETFLTNVDSDALDLITWHYYPVQSERCPLGAPASAEDLLTTKRLDQVLRYIERVKTFKMKYQDDADIWLGETGSAQCGGKEGVSDRFAGSFWWLDHLGLLAKNDIKLAARQTLTGSFYGLIDNVSLQPNPDYWASVLWKRNMSNKVLDVRYDTDHPVRIYGHCHANDRNSFTLLVINTDDESSIGIDTSEWSGNSVRSYRITSDRLDSPEIAINGIAMHADQQGDFMIPENEILLGDQFVVGKRSMAFIQVLDANFAACQ